MGRREPPLLSKRGFLSSPNPTSFPQHDQERLDPCGFLKKDGSIRNRFFYVWEESEREGLFPALARVRKTSGVFI